MITNDDIENFIEKIPPKPEILQATIKFLNDGNLPKAAKMAEQDLALKAYLTNLVNKPIYGFRTEVSDISQIFGILSLSGSQQTVYNYMLSLLCPKKWELFNLNENSFHELQANLSLHWKKILEFLNIDNKEIESAITLLPASIIISEALFGTKKRDVEILRSVNALDYNTILIRLCDTSLFNICNKIATKWGMSEQIKQIVFASSGLNPSDDENVNILAKWMHLLLFYELSQKKFIEAGLNDFINFQPEYVQDIYEDFSKVMEL